MSDTGRMDTGTICWRDLTVENAEQVRDFYQDRGGDVVAGPRAMGGGRFCVIRDPAGAVCALYRPPE